MKVVLVANIVRNADMVSLTDEEVVPMLPWTEVPPWAEVLV